MGIYTLREKGIVSLFGDNGAEERKKRNLTAFQLLYSYAPLLQACSVTYVAFLSSLPWSYYHSHRFPSNPFSYKLFQTVA